MKKVAIMQPYFFPYIGYYQLMSCVDDFVIYDNIEFTKKGWINRNRILQNGSDKLITLPIKKNSDFLHISERQISETAKIDNQKTLNLIEACYRKAPYFKESIEMIIQCLQYENNNLFDYLLNSLKKTTEYIGLEINFVRSSDIDINHNLKGQDKVIAICKKLEANIYVNAIGGTSLYSRDMFNSQNIELKFIKTKDIKYDQFGQDFVPNLSIIDIIMFNSRDEIKTMMDAYELI